MSARSRRVTIVVVIVLLLLLLALLLPRCSSKQPPMPAPPPVPAASPSAAPGPAPVATPAQQPEERLSPATITVPERITAGAAFTVTWTGPANAGDFVVIVRSGSTPDAPGNYRPVNENEPAELVAPIEAGSYEVRYVAARSRSILARAAIKVDAVLATLDASAEIALGAPFEVRWTGPANAGDYVTIVLKGAADDQYGSYVEVARGSPLSLTAPTQPGDAELRYVTGQGRKVLARRPVRVAAADVSLDAPAEAVAGSTIEVKWAGPGNAGDFITVVSADTPDGRYGNYTNTSKSSPVVKLLLPIMSGEAELRYMTGQGNRVLGRRSIRVVAAQVTLQAPPQCAAGSTVQVQWTGPNNPGDYITIVPKNTPDGQYGQYTNTSRGSPMGVRAPAQTGDAEVRYMTGQGNKVLARVSIKVVS